MSGGGTARERHLAQSFSGRRSGGERLGLTNVLFRPVTLISLILIGFFAFGALIVLGGFAKDLRKAPPGQATPRSVSAVGYEALTDYLERLDYDVQETRGNRDYFDRENRLVVYTPSRPSRRLNRALVSEGKETRLVILPKWSVAQLQLKRGEEGQPGWARKTRGDGTYYEALYDNLIDDMPIVRRSNAPSADAQISFAAPLTGAMPDNYQPDFQALQYFDLMTRWPDYLDTLREERRVEAENARREAAEARGETYEPKAEKSEKKSGSENTEDETPEGETPEEDVKAPEPLPTPEVILEIDGNPVLIRLEETQTYILSEPDLVNTMAFRSQGGAQLASAIIDKIIQEQGIDQLSIDFDVSLHGIEANRNIIKLMVTPPFLAATLCLLAAGGLVAWQGFNRFGDPARVRPDYAQGPVSLARTAAEFMGIANRAHRTGEAYADLIRRQVAAQLGYKSRSGSHIDTLLNAREKRLSISPSFEDLKNAIANADPQSYRQYARSLTTWRDAMIDTEFQPNAPADS